MTLLSDVGSWIAAHESVLSGIAAMIVVGGVVFSPLGSWLGRRPLRRAPGVDAVEQGVGGTGSTRKRAGAPASPPDAPQRITLKALTSPSPYETKFAHSDEVRIAYNERGEGPITIVSAPGIFSHLHVLSNLPASKATLEALSGFARVISFDKRGQGLSDPTLSAPDLEERTRDIEAVMDAAGADRAVLMGYSEGGPMCLSFAHRNPDRVLGLVLVGSTARWLQSEDFPIGLPRAALEGLAEAWGTGRLRDVFFPSLSREVLDDDTYRAFERLIGNRTAVRQLTAMMLQTDVRPLLPEIHVPTLVVHFSGDLAVPSRLGRALAEGLPNAEFLEVSAVDHADLSQSPLAIERIRAFCEQVAGTTPELASA